MSDTSNLQGATEVDPLSGAASGWEAPKFPCLMPERICRFKIKDADKHPTKEDPSREVLSLCLTTEKDYTDTEGKPLRSGFKVFHHVGVTPSEETDTKRARTWKNIGADLGMILKAAGLGSKSPRDLLNDPSMLEGQIVDCKVGLAKASGGFPESNKLTFVMPA